MKQNDDCNFVLPCFSPSKATGFILFKNYGTCMITIYASEEEIPHMGEYALCVHLKRILNNFADFETRQ